MHIWHLNIETALQSCPSASCANVSEDEQVQADKYINLHSQLSFVRRKCFLRYVLSRYINKSPREIRFVFSQAKKPYLCPTENGGRITFSASSSGNLILIAVSKRSEVGIDVQKHEDLSKTANSFVSLAEHNLLSSMTDTNLIANTLIKCWTRKEAILKAKGTGLLYDPCSLTVVGGWAHNRTQAKINREYVVADLDLKNGYAVSVATKTSQLKLDTQIFHYSTDISQHCSYTFGGSTELSLYARPVTV